MKLYLILNVLIISVPLLFSFEKKIFFFKKFRSYLFSISIVSVVYIVWDIIATARGDWSFNSNYLLGINIFNLPIEEVLFFITVPYACLFIYETVKFYLPEKIVKLPNMFYDVVSVLIILIAIIFVNQDYTFTVLLFSVLFLVCTRVFQFELLHSSNYWLTLAITYIPFIIVNYILTSTPIVSYSDNAIWGLRITTIPVEDFFYSFSMISWWIFFYNLSEKKFTSK